MEQRTEIDRYLQSIREINGWFFPEDVQLFTKINELQAQQHGDLMEIGVYQGKSAILLGCFAKIGESLAVCDLFGAPAGTALEQKENEQYYRNLTQSTFETNYLRFHDALPTVLRCSSTELDGKVSRGTFRFVHIDGSHQYDIVRKDIETAKALLMNGGVAVFDDYRSFHTPGVAAAVWQGVAAGLIHPLCVTPFKLYAIVGPDQFNLLPKLKSWAQSRSDLAVEAEFIAGSEVLRVKVREKQTSVLKKIYWQLSSYRRERKALTQ